jgi:GT2 family glycosyltransferase
MVGAMQGPRPSHADDSAFRASGIATSRPDLSNLDRRLSKDIDVAAVMIAWNSMDWLPGALESLEQQNHPLASITIVDNASTDGVAEFVASRHPRATVLRNQENLGFAAAVNQGIRASTAEWVLVLNPDLTLERDHVSQLLLAATERPDAGMLGGLLRRPDGQVDSAGLELHRYLLRPLDRTVSPARAGSQPEVVFGICAAAALYRRAMLEDTAYHGEYFDTAFFAYYEDVDLAWRACHRGWKAYFVPSARGMHVRGASEGERSHAGQVRSQRNRYLALYKNLPARRLLLDLLPILGIEAARMVRHAGTQSAGLVAALRLAHSRHEWRAHIQQTARPDREWYLKA